MMLDSCAPSRQKRRPINKNRPGSRRGVFVVAEADMQNSIGLDFGTTNTVATIINREGQVEALHFNHADQSFDAFRSVLCFWQTLDEQENQRTNVEAGPWA